LSTATAFRKLDDAPAVIEALRDATEQISVVDDGAAREAVRAAFVSVGVKGKGLEDAALKAFAVKDPEVEPSVDSKGRTLPDSDLRDSETIPVPLDPRLSWLDASEVVQRFDWEPYQRTIEHHMTNEVLPYVSDAWVDHTKTRVGYDLPFTRLFYVYEPPRPLDEIRKDLRQSQERILELLSEVGALDA